MKNGHTGVLTQHCFSPTLSIQKCLKDRIAALESQLAEERQRCRVAEKKAEMLNGGSVSGVDDEGGLQVSQSEDAAYREREKELLRFEVRVAINYTIYCHDCGYTVNIESF